MKLHWYKRFPESALAGMKSLTLEERGAYNTVLDLIYFHGGELEDDDQFIAGWCSCDVRIWKRIKVRLLALGKLYASDGKVRNGRADKELPKAIGTVTANSYAGRQSALIRAAKLKRNSNKINGLSPSSDPTDVEQPLQPFLEPRNNNLTVSNSADNAASASAGPDGPPRPRLPDSAMWADRLDQFRPWLPHAQRGRWEPPWGPRPDSAGTNPFIPPLQLAAWRLFYNAKMREARAGVAA